VIVNKSKLLGSICWFVVSGVVMTTTALAQSEEGEWIFSEDTPLNDIDEAPPSEMDQDLDIDELSSEQWQLPEEPYYEYQEPESVGSAQASSQNVPAASDTHKEPLPLVLEDPPSKPKGNLFGRYRIHLGAMRPDFSEIPSYGDHYGRTVIAPTLTAEYYPFDFFIPLGLRMQASLYNDRGKASRSAAEWEEDKDQVTTFSMVPMQISLVAQFPLMFRKWLVGSVWYGLERVAVQETRQVSGGDQDTEVFVNRATKSANVLGAALSIRISPEGGGRSAGFVSAISYNNIYFTPYLELVSAESNGIDVGGQRLGLAFTFEIR